MKCKSVEKKLIFYLEGDLPVEENRWIEEHLVHCTECTAKLDFLSQSLQHINMDKAIEPKPFLYTRIKARMESHQKSNVRQWTLAPLAAASFLAMGLLMGTLVGKLTINLPFTIENNQYEVGKLFVETQLEGAEFRLLNEK